MSYQGLEMTITVWGGATSRTIRVHWALHELGLDYEPKLIGSRTGETQRETFQSLNSKEKIPVLVDDDFVLTESAAIVTYLGDKYGLLTPTSGSRERARYDEWT
ncbi:MAG: glutathione S-transferase N-terminal domain-containing protein, partial [Pseudomonadota bacterium]|nr:glutathione S-transferase N-terminal domain-containing protein [Pseudomonadota bacterium]